MGAVYVAARVAVTPTVDETILALTSGASEGAEVIGISCAGEATASAIQTFVLRRSSTNGATPTAQTPAKKSPLSPASVIAVATTWGTQPTTAADPATWTRGYNAFGGIIHWIAAPGHGVRIASSTAGDSEVSFEADIGTSPVSAEIIFEEL